MGPRHTHLDGQYIFCPSAGAESVRKSTNCVQTTTHTQWEKVAMLADRRPPPKKPGLSEGDRRSASPPSRSPIAQFAQRRHRGRRVVTVRHTGRCR
ncbi:hypothetical protein HPB50_016601 [Hyalomma asiaticum]|uniref:Uncharacterized protein n=1 Tax=Hyalomma asiaticum TaxID=266040 RepID=A0ACB7S3J3_HYAAI|nr:hypothetical protein HPB50_016601 [Hyalomma asiaticum]